MGQLNPFAAVVEKIVANALAENPKEGDFTGEDGLLHCGVCKKPKQYLAPWYDGTKKIVPIRCQCVEERMAREKLAIEIEEMKKASNIEPKYLKSSFADIKVVDNNKRAVSICKRYVDVFEDNYRENQGLLLFGPTGTGKTMLAHAVAVELMNRRHSAGSISLAKILDKGLVDKEEEARIMHLVGRVELLIIDDLGAERNTDFAQQFVYSVLDTRSNLEKPMIITSNLTLADMQNCKDIRLQRIYDRILEVCYPIELSGVSWRMRNAANRYDKVTRMLEGSD